MGLRHFVYGQLVYGHLVYGQLVYATTRIRDNSYTRHLVYATLRIRDISSTARAAFLLPNTALSVFSKAKAD